MDTGLISRRYAKALLAYARKYGVEQQVYDLTGRLYWSFEQFPALHRVLGNKTVSDPSKEEVIRLAAGGETNPQFDKFIALVLRQVREEFLQMFCLSYRQLYRRETGLLDVELVTAVELDDVTRKKLIDRISEHTGAEIRLKIRVNPEIIGGYIFRWDTYRLDASVRSKLRRIRRQMYAGKFT